MTLLDFGNWLIDGNQIAAIHYKHDRVCIIVAGEYIYFDRADADPILQRWLNGKRAAGSLLELKPASDA